MGAGLEREMGVEVKEEEDGEVSEMKLQEVISCQISVLLTDVWPSRAQRMAVDQERALQGRQGGVRAPAGRG